MELVQRLRRLVEEALEQRRPYAFGLVTAVSGSAGNQTVSARLDGATTTMPGIPVVRDVTVSVGDYVLVARLSQQALVVIGRLPATS